MAARLAVVGGLAGVWLVAFAATGDAAAAFVFVVRALGWTFMRPGDPDW